MLLFWQRFRRAGLLIPALFALPGTWFLASLGNWQMERRAWKQDLTAKIEQRRSLAPQPAAALAALACPPPGAADADYACQFIPVRLTGTFDHAGERHVYATVSPTPGRGAVAGFFVFTPFRIDGFGYDIAVNRGFVPEAYKDAATRPPGQLEGTIEITGLTRAAQPRGTFDATDDPARNIYFVRDPVLLGLVPAPSGAGARQAPLGVSARAWYYVDQSAPVPPGGLPQPMPGPAALTNRHLEYALTWYALAATLAAMFLAFAYTRLSRPTEQ